MTPAAGPTSETVEHALEALAARGWARFAAEPGLAAWASAVAPTVATRIAEPNAPWRAGGTWFAGVSDLDNAADGSLAALGAPPLAGLAVKTAQTILQALPGAPALAFDQGQLSVVRAGYPRQDPGERDAAFRFRRDRDAAHVDGLLRDRPPLVRALGERHAFILGIPLGDPAEGASPLAVWEGAHRIIGPAMAAALAGVAPEDWETVDVAPAYQAARRRCFEESERRLLPARRGEAYLLHRHMLHGVSPWRADPNAPARAIAYFRPEPSVSPSSDCG